MNTRYFIFFLSALLSFARAATVDVAATDAQTAPPAEGAFPFFNPDTGEWEHILGKHLGSATDAIAPSTGGLWFDGTTNNAPVTHILTSTNINQRPFSFYFEFVCPALSDIKAGGRGIGGISASDPTSSLNSSFTLGIRGTSGYGNVGTAAGDLICKVITSSGSDLDMVVSGFVNSYAGKRVRVLFTRGLTAVDFPVKLYVNGVKVEGIEQSGSGSGWGLSLGASPYFFYGCQTTTRQWAGEILAAGVACYDLSESEALSFSKPETSQIGSVVWGSVISNRDSDFNAYSGFGWDNWTQSGASYTESGGGTINPSAGDAYAWADGQVNGTTAPGKLRLTAKASTGVNRTYKTGATAGRKYTVSIRARLVSGTAVPLYLGFGHNISNAVQDTAAGEMLVFTPGATEQEFTGVVTARTDGLLTLGMVTNADSAGQVFEFDTCTVTRAGWAEWADLSYGAGLTVPNYGTTSFDGVIPAAKNIQWAVPRRAASVLLGGTGHTTYTNGQILIGNTSTGGLDKATLAGTANQVTVTGGAGTITLSGPQDLATSSSPTFATVTATTFAGSLSLPTNTRQTFAPGATSAGLNVGSYAGNPSTLQNGDIWYNSATTRWMIYMDGIVRTLTTDERSATLSNKTLASPTISGTTSGTYTLGGGATWNGAVIGSAYGGAGAVSGLLKSNGSGTVSAAVSGTDYMPASVSVPASASATGVAGTVAYDASYFYVCVATNTWVRTPLSTW